MATEDLIPLSGDHINSSFSSSTSCSTSQPSTPLGPNGTLASLFEPSSNKTQFTNHTNKYYNDINGFLKTTTNNNVENHSNNMKLIEHRRFASADSSLIDSNKKVSFGEIAASNLIQNAITDSSPEIFNSRGCFINRTSQIIQDEAITSSCDKRSHEEDIYEDLCYVSLRSHREQENILGTLYLEPIEKRDYCIKEMVETEKNYCEALRMIINHFYQPLSTVLVREDRYLIFNNLKSLTELHSKFYQELYRTCSNNKRNEHHSNVPPPSPSSLNISSAISMPALNMFNNINNSNSHQQSASPTIKPPSNEENSNFSSFQTQSFPFSSSMAILSNSTANNNNSNNRLSQCFLNFKDKFLMYGNYCSQLPKAQKLLDELCLRNELIGQQVKICQNKANDGKFKLRDLLSLPMQRILKYHLLLGELIKNTGEKHEDYDGLKQAHDVMLDIGSYINEVKRDTETLEIIENVQQSILDLSMPDNYELKDYGRLIKDGDVKMRTSDDPKPSSKLKTRYMFVFDKLVLLCKALRGLHYTYKESILLADFKLEDLANLSPVSKFTKNWSNGWTLTNTRGTKSYTFFVKNDEIKKKWIEAIERAQENDRPKSLLRTDHRFQMSTVPMGTYCGNCRKLLHGIWFQGYHCQQCNVSVHKKCIPLMMSCVRTKKFNSSLSDNSNSEQQHSASAVTSETAVRQSNSLSMNQNSDFNSKQVSCTAPPTPFRAKRILARANTHNHCVGQLMFDLNDIILVFAKHGNQWFGRNIRTNQEGIFLSSMVSDLVVDSPASSSLESPTVGNTSALRFSYEDPTTIVSNNNFVASSFHSDIVPFHTLPRKLNSPHSNSSSPSSQSVLIPASPLAASTPAINNNAIPSNGNFFFGHSVPSTQVSSNFNQQIPQTPSMTENTKIKLFFGNGYNLEEYAWFAGSMDRDTAQTTLSPLSSGSYLVRISPKQKNSYAISLNFNGQVKHMRVQVTDTAGISPTTIHSNNPHSNIDSLRPGNKQTSFYLSETRYFQTIVDLVRWYEMNSLSESFNMVNTKLSLPYKKAYCSEVIGQAVALYAFTGTSSASSSFLSLKKGDHITVLSRQAEDKGWWKGQLADRIGYFPFKYVSPITPKLKTQLKNHNSNQYQSNVKLTDFIFDNNHHSPDSSCQMMMPTNKSLNSTIASLANVCDLINNSFLNTNSNDVSAKKLTSSESSTSSQTTLSSPVDSDTLSVDVSHSRQASSDAGIEIPEIITDDHKENFCLSNQIAE